MKSSSEITNTSSLTMIEHGVQRDRLGLGEAVDIEISVLSAGRIRNLHRLKRNPFYYIELLVGSATQCTNAAQSDGGSILWDKGFILTATASSNLTVRMYCKHHHVRDDHIVGEASFGVLDLERNKDIEIELYGSTNLAQKTAAIAHVILRLRVALSVTFKVGTDAEMDFQSSACLNEMEKIVGSISSDKFKQLPPAWIRLFNSLETFSSLAQKVAELDSRAQVAVGAMASAIKVLVDQIKRDERIEALGRIMCELYEYVVDACTVRKIASFEKTLQKLLSQTAECAYFITDYQRITIFAQRALFNMISNADEMISNFEISFGELKIALILGSSLQTALVSYRILQTVEQIENMMLIDRLPSLQNVGWDSGKVCLRGTRGTTIKSIVRWASQRGSSSFTHNIYLLSGPVSCGKSTIAHSIAKLFHEQNRLGAAVFLHGALPEHISQSISSSIIQQLAAYHSIFQARITAKIKADQSLIWADFERQFRVLVVDTANSADSILMIGPIFIVIDNLHLIGDEERYKILNTLSDNSTSLPPNFRFLITCRDDDTVARRTLRSSCLMDPIGYDDNSSIDMGRHITESLINLFSQKPQLTERYSIQDLQNTLESRARGMYFWISTVYRSVLVCQGDDVFLFLSLLLTAPSPLSNNEAMDQLYHAIFKVFFRLELGAQHLFDVMIQSSKPLPWSYLRRVACIPWEPANRGNIVDTAKAIGLITEIDRDQKGESLCDIHPSLEDFLTNPRRCEGTGVYVDRAVPVDQSAAEVCIHIMNQSLRYNICRLEDIMAMNAEIQDKDEIVERYIPKSLRYACSNWTLHLEGEGRDLDDTLRHKLYIFTSSHMLHWIEAMSILGNFGNIEVGLSRFLRWLQVREVKASDLLYAVTADAIRFVMTFSSIISKAALQTYVSAAPLLPKAPESSLFRQHALDIAPNRSINTGQVETSWKRVSEHTFKDNLSSCSHDGLVALGLRSGSVSLFRTRTKSSIECQINVHQGIQAMAFSPDGQNLITVTVDGLMSVHNVASGAHIHSFETKMKNPFIFYSNDSKTILLVNYQSGIGHTSDYHLWDAANGSLILSGSLLLQDPQGLALSPDGQQIALPSDVGAKIFDLAGDTVIREIDMSSGKRDRRNEKNCVTAWSSDGSMLAVSRGADATTRLSNLRDGTSWTTTIDAMRGPTSSHALSFSPNSSMLVLSQSYPRTEQHDAMVKVRIWDTTTGLLIHQEEIEQGNAISLNRHQSISPDNQEITLLSNSYSRNHNADWDTSVNILSDIKPAYISSPPMFGDQNSVPTILHTFTGREPSQKYASTVDFDGWIVNSEGTRFVIVPYPDYDISTSHPSPTSTRLEIKHPENKQTVLNYIFGWEGHGEPDIKNDHNTETD